MYQYLIKIKRVVILFIVIAGTGFTTGGTLGFAQAPPEAVGANPLEANALQLPTTSVALPTDASQIPPPGQYAAKERVKHGEYQRVLELLMPLQAQQIEQIIQSLDVNERLSSAPASPPPAPIMAVEALKLDARTPPVVRVAQGYGASIVFTDSTGKAWPMTAFQGFNDQLFVLRANSISGDPQDLPTVLTIQPTAPYGMGNALVTLKGLETPIVLTISLGQSEVDVRKEFRLAKPGPNARPQYAAAPLPPRAEPALLNVLNGLPPQASARAVALQGAEPEARAWAVGGHYYIRTRAAIYSPAYEQRSSSTTGIHAYKLRKTPVILASVDGAMTELLLED